VAELDSYADEYDYSGYEEGEDFDSSMIEEAGPADQTRGRIKQKK
jgi:hypothetical protein